MIRNNTGMRQRPRPDRPRRADEAHHQQDDDGNTSDTWECGPSGIATCCLTILYHAACLQLIVNFYEDWNRQQQADLFGALSFIIGLPPGNRWSHGWPDLANESRIGSATDRRPWLTVK
jgi:hypothetical protein